MSAAAALTKEKLIAEAVNSEDLVMLSILVDWHSSRPELTLTEKIFLSVFVTWLRTKFFFLNMIGV
jgi:hypothetical protein